jgi:hypothetical protein
MSVSGEHLSQQMLGEKAMEVLTELNTLLEAVNFKQHTSNLYRCENSPALRTMVQRLIKELQFIRYKVEQISSETIIANRVGSNPALQRFPHNCRRVWSYRTPNNPGIDWSSISDSSEYLERQPNYFESTI